MKQLSEFPPKFQEILWDMRDHQQDNEQKIKLTDWANALYAVVNDTLEFWDDPVDPVVSEPFKQLQLSELFETFQALLENADPLDWYFFPIPPPSIRKTGESWQQSVTEYLYFEDDARYMVNDCIDKKARIYLTWEGMCKGLDLLRVNQRKHYDQAVDCDDRGDIDTADMWLQYTLFGEIKYVV